MKMSNLTPFDFIKSVSETKVDLMSTADMPDDIEKQYNPYMVNRGFSYFPDTILHANEMNMNHQTFKRAQYMYYMSALRTRKRFSKWFKLEKNEDLDMVQKYYQCNRLVAKQYLDLLDTEKLKEINKSMDVGG